MEQKHEISGGVGSNPKVGCVSARWNPTKEQIDILEGLYIREGVRTPSAEQIQQITRKLREFGAIEGKNVFYWFQNHKARQRQREKHDTFAFFSRRLIDPATQPPQAVLDEHFRCASRGFGGGYRFYLPQKPAALLNGVIGSRNKLASFSEDCYYQCSFGFNGDEEKIDEKASTDDFRRRTLELFPVHPTGVLTEKCVSSWTSTSLDSGSSLEEAGEEFDDHRPFFNFLGASPRTESF